MPMTPQQQQIVNTFISFALGIGSALFIDYLKRRREKQSLINVFLAEIRRIWPYLDGLKMAPDGEVLARARSELYGIRGLNFRGAPEYELEVYNTKLFETDGVKLAQQLKVEGRQKFWFASGYLRNAEAIRLLLRALSKDEQDREQYQKLFVILAGKAAEALIEFQKALYKERAWIEDFRESKQR